MNKTNKEILEDFKKRFVYGFGFPKAQELYDWFEAVLEKKDAEIEEASKICKNCGRKLVERIEAKLSKEKK